MGRLLISAPKSGSGKTLITMGLLALWKQQKKNLASYKCGPDYIDPMFHQRVLGIPCRNLDSYLFGWQDVREDLERVPAEGAAVIEGAMGLYDGLGGAMPHSAYDLARRTHTPIVVVVPMDTEHPAEDLGELIKKDISGQIKGFLCNRCTEEEAEAFLEEITANHPALTYFGYLPKMDAGEFSSRHLGLVTAIEVTDFEARISAVCKQVESTINTEKLWEMAMEAEPLSQIPTLPAMRPTLETEPTCCRIGIASDEAFCFYYERSKEHLQAMGALLIPFSPLHDAHLPKDLDALYIGGGYPELYGKELEENGSMREEIRAAIAYGIPTIAECGGFLYLQERLVAEDGTSYAMVGALPGESRKQEKLVRFGYCKLEPEANSMLFSQGRSVEVHEFHYWDSTHNGEDIPVVKASKQQTWRCGYTSDHLYAGFPHIYLDWDRARHFVDAAMEYRSMKKWDSLAKPLRSLGRMETLINRVAGITHTLETDFSKPRLYVLCGDNGIIAEGVSQSDATVTAEVAYSLAKGESTVCHLAKHEGCEVIPVDVGMAAYTPREGIWDYSLGRGTKNFRWEAAMTWDQVLRAFSNGEELVLRAKEDGKDVLLLGEMGIGNTTTSSAMASVLLEMPVEEVTGRGAGLSDEGLQRKIHVIQEAIARHGHALTNPMDVLLFLGGFDIATLVGTLFGAEKHHMPVILDGFITDVAALVACRMNPDVARVILPSHLSMEPACKKLYEALGLEPLITADMHLGEGSGAVMALGLYRTAMEVYHSGHTFEQLGIDAYTIQK